MCELFALSSRLPTTFGLSMRRLASHGSPGGQLADGWGVACYDGNDARVLREPEPAGDSAWLRFIDGRRLRSRIALAHIRHATQGGVSLPNTQPFARELGGRRHVFAHNGMLPGIEQLMGAACRRFRPIGTTDSEVACCALLERLAPLWSHAVPGVGERVAVVSRFAAELRAVGPANFLYADGELLFAHGHRRTQADGRIAPPGLAMLVRQCAVDRDTLPEAGVAVQPEAGPQVLTLFASVPLSDEAWRTLDEGEIVVVRDGEVVRGLSATPQLQ
jgi:predicted glutamine amidotransferase